MVIYKVLCVKSQKYQVAASCWLHILQFKQAKANSILNATSIHKEGDTSWGVHMFVWP